MTNIDEIMSLLDWNRTEYEQETGIQMGMEVQCIKAFFQPAGQHHKNVWHNCARIISMHTDDQLIPYLLDMLLWIQDLNWPGSLIIMQRLKQFSNVKMLARLIEHMLPALEALDDTPWILSIAELLDNQELAQEINRKSLAFISKLVSLIDE